jgi:hypothetical protein
MRPTRSRRALLCVLVVCIALLAIGAGLFSVALATDVVPPFTQRIVLGDQTFLEISSGRTCPPEIPHEACSSLWLGKPRMFSVTYRAPDSIWELISIELPER